MLAPGKNKFLATIAILFGCHLFDASPASSHLKLEVEAPCAVLRAFDGQVQILDSERSHLTNAKPKLPLPCGSWVSVIQGWATIQHQNGARIQAGNETFLQILSVNSRSKNSSKKDLLSKDPMLLGDHLILYRGQIFAAAEDGVKELRIVSPVSRVRLKEGKVLFLSRDGDDEAQLIVLHNSASLENRFEPSRKVKVKEGESTTLNFKLQRVIPTIPQAVSVASLKSHIYSLQLAEDDESQAIRSAVQRSQRKFASELPDTHEDKKSTKEDLKTPEKFATKNSNTASRNPASSSGSKAYLRHEPNSPSEGELHKHWVDKMVGDAGVGEQILFPDKFEGRSQKVHLDIDDTIGSRSQHPPHRLQKQEEAEKKRLIHELSQIHAE